MAAPTRADPALLERLARLAGIQPEHRDALGHVTRVSPQTQRALLKAMRLPADTPSDIAASLHALQTGPWRRALAPFITAAADAPLTFDLTVDATAAGRPAEIIVACEDGTRHALSVHPGEGRLIDARRVDGQTRERWRIATDLALPCGLHRLQAGKTSATVAAAPGGVWQSPALAGTRKCWGVAANLYSVRTSRDWGIGDFTTLRDLASHVGADGGAFVGVNPLHALFADKPERASPYYPSDRRFLETAYIDPAGMPGYAALRDSEPWFAEAEAKAARLRAAPLIDHGAVARLKQQVFARIWSRFRERHLHAGDAMGDDFKRFVSAGGETLRQFAAFQAGTDAERLQQHLFLQWWADRTLGDAMAEAGLPIGLYRDLAIGPAPDGAEVQAGGVLFAAGVSIGAPPDAYAPDGQVWGVPPYDPHALARAQYGPWATLLRANMRHAGALRLDHAMGLERLLWIPDGATARDGAYVANDSAALLAVLAVESHRARCMVIGEDLGTVPAGFRERMAQAGIFSLAVMLFERDGPAFRGPHAYPPQSLASFATHDLAPLHGWWRQHRGDADGHALGRALCQVLGHAVEADAGAGADRADEARALSLAVHGFLGASRAKMATAQLDDLAGEEEP
ncbi:MAG: hypothetical protein D6782_01825, partial [Alphaproteobacteria bacterium]